ncbi:MAG TPA: GH25 family lysozyme [Caproiciproducens sp.]|nr:GH25 family lysozyme [Caproiciproducens sp.]
MKKILSLVLTLAVIAFFSIPAMTVSASDTLTLDQSSIAVKPGDFTTLTASLNGIATSDVSWSAADPSIATVSGGTVTGVSLGMTTVTATTGSGLSAACTVSVAYKGIDVSKYQQTVDWDRVKSSGIDFAFIRAGYTGLDSLTPQTDPYFSSNYSGALNAGLKVGAYYYSCATNVAMAQQEANALLSILGGRRMDYPVVYDIEYSGHRTMASEALADVVITFCDTMQAAGYKVAIYSSPSIFNTNLSSSRLDVYDRWVAHWGVSAPNFSKPFTVWQYGYGTVPGITSGVVDMDYSFKDYASGSQPGGTQPSDGPDNGGQPAPVTQLVSDTTSYIFGTNSTYIFKLTTDSASAPAVESSDTSVVKVSYYQRVSGGYLYKMTNIGQGTAQITATASDGTSISFAAVGNTAGVTCDTTMSFTMKKGATYTFKLTPYGSAGVPNITTGNSAVLSVASKQKIGDSYYIKVVANAEGCTSVYTTIAGQSPVRQCMVTVSAQTATAPTTPVKVPTQTKPASGVTCDTTVSFSMKRNATYVFKLTPYGSAGIPLITTGNGSVLSVISTQKIGASYYIKVLAKARGCTSVYTTVSGQSPVRQCMVTVL